MTLDYTVYLFIQLTSRSSKEVITLHIV